MGQSKFNKFRMTRLGAAAFPDEVAQEAEASECLEFAIAMHRVTKWPITLIRDGDTVLRAVTCDSASTFYDVRGMLNNQGILDLLYSRHPAATSTLRFLHVDEWEVEAHGADAPSMSHVHRFVEAIEANRDYLDLTVERRPPILAATDLRTYTEGACFAFAVALSEKLQLPTCEIRGKLGRSFVRLEGHDGPDGETLHAGVVKPDERFIDAWGEQSLDAVAARFWMPSYSAWVGDSAGFQSSRRMASWTAELERARGVIKEAFGTPKSGSPLRNLPDDKGWP